LSNFFIEVLCRHIDLLNDYAVARSSNPSAEHGFIPRLHPLSLVLENSTSDDKLWVLGGYNKEISSIWMLQLGQVFLENLTDVG
jgi:hypothetical protein